MATLIGLLPREGKKLERRKTKKKKKSQVGKKRANKEGREWAGDGGAAED